MRPYKRSARVGDLLRQEIADIILNKIKYKSLGFVTVTGAKISDDLRNATVFISVLKDEDADKTLRKLSEAASFIKGELGRRLKMRVVPELHFRIDEAMLYGRKIDKLLDDIGSERSVPGDDEDLF